MDFNKYLVQTAKKLDREIQKILNEWLKDVEKTDKSLVSLAKAFIESCDGGKRIRGALVRLGYETVKTRLPDGILKVGAAYEIFHTAILVHDDIIDESPKRRGQKSLYKSVGIPQAITLGDLGFFLAAKIISESNFPAQKKIKALNLFSKTMIDTTVGQMLDIARGDRKIIAKLKTARYTIAGPLQIGAILAGADQDLVKKLGEFGEELGIAFQIRDDILDKEVESVELAEKQVIEYTSRAEKLIPKITNDKKMTDLLQEMTQYLVKRRK